MFLLQSTGRSGSTYLRSLLMSHGQLNIDGEILTPDATPNLFYHFWAEEVKRDAAWLSPERRNELVRNYLRSRQDDSGRKYGTDLKLEHLHIVPWVTNEIYNLADRVILLKRMNVLKQVVSYELMMSRLRENWKPVHSEFTPEARKVYLDPELAIIRMRERVDLVRGYEAMVRARKIPVFVVIYEDLTGESAIDLLAELQRFLEVEPVRLASRLVKQNPQPLSTLIKNYGDVVKAVKASEFAYTLYLPT